jgi:hypothetical protein
MAAAVVVWEERSCVAGVTVKVSVTLNRKYVLKEGVAPEAAVKVSSWGASTDRDKVDKAKGEFFLSFETGSWDEETKRIVPVSDDQAKEIVEKRCSFEEYVSLFGDPRGVIVTPEAIQKAVAEQRSSDYEERALVTKERDVARARVYELEDRIRELENR